MKIIQTCSQRSFKGVYKLYDEVKKSKVNNWIKKSKSVKEIKKWQFLFERVLIFELQYFDKL